MNAIITNRVFHFNKLFQVVAQATVGFCVTMKIKYHEYFLLFCGYLSKS